MASDVGADQAGQTGAVRAAAETEPQRDVEETACVDLEEEGEVLPVHFQDVEGEAEYWGPVRVLVMVR